MCEPSFLADEETGQIIGHWKFEVPLREIQNLPDIPGWLYEEIERHQEQPRWVDDDVVVSNIDCEGPSLYHFKQGERNSGMARIAGMLRFTLQIVDDENFLFKLLRVCNKSGMFSPRLPTSEVQTIAKSIMQRPLTLKQEFRTSQQPQQLQSRQPQQPQRPYHGSGTNRPSNGDRIEQAIYKKYKQDFEQK
jgi:hypothetical protein